MAHSSIAPKASVKEDRVARLSITTLRTLAMDAVQKANSGHPGTAMALAPVAYTLWQQLLRFDPEDPIWPNRDRFVLSAGHASMLLYALLHLSGTHAVDAQYEILGEPAVSLEDIRKFRQLGSKCPGHPEYRLVSGVEATTGPLGQGAANSVGMAITSKWLAERYNRPGFKLFDFQVYVIASDGDLMEGVSGEAASLAGHLKLDNLFWIYDSNHISIDGRTEIAFTEDVGKRFEAYGWEVDELGDVNDLAQVREKFSRRTHSRPFLLIAHSHIGYGAPHRQDTALAHGEPLGEEEVRLAKRFYGWPEDAHFLVPEEVRKDFETGVRARGRSLRNEWMKRLLEYRQKFPELARELDCMQRQELPVGWDQDLPSFPADSKGMASREASATVMNRIARNVPWFLGGAADLAASTKTKIEGGGDFEPGSYSGRNLHFGIREHAMGSIINGMALSKLRPYASTFLIFSDYERPAIRLSAIMEIPTLQIFTHDSISLGEDGPTHQPVEQLPSLRAIPGLVVLRPADANEVVEAWKAILQLNHQPAALILTRQPLPTFDRSKLAPASGLQHGAYILAEAPGGRPQVLLLASGSEVQFCLQAQTTLEKEGIAARVISMPSWELFEKQPESYRNQVLPLEILSRVSIEQASTFGWERWTGLSGERIGMRSFGASAPLKDILKYFGFTAEHVAEAARKQVHRK